MCVVRVRVYVLQQAVEAPVNLGGCQCDPRGRIRPLGQLYFGNLLFSVWAFYMLEKDSKNSQGRGGEREGDGR